MRTENSVLDGERLNDEQLGRLTRRFRDIERRVGAVPEKFGHLLEELQKVAEGIGGKIEDVNPTTTLYAVAKRIMGNDLRGIEAVEKVFGIKIEEKDLPPIRCSKIQLKRFKRFGFQLILEIDRMSSGHPVTIRLLNALAGGMTQDGGKFLFSSDGGKIKQDAWYKSESFLDEPLLLCWRVSMKDIVSGTLSKNYLEQTKILIDLLGKVFDGKVPQEYIEAIKFFEMKKDEIAAYLRNGDWKVVGDVIQGCAVDKLIRESTISLIYRMYLTERATGEKIFPTTYIWTATRDSVGEFVHGGSFDWDGADVRSCRPVYDWNNVGASLSLKL